MADPKKHSKSDPKVLKEAETLWHSFNKITKQAIVGICAILILLAIILL